MGNSLRARVGDTSFSPDMYILLAFSLLILYLFVSLFCC